MSLFWSPGVEGVVCVWSVIPLPIFVSRSPLLLVMVVVAVVSIGKSLSVLGRVSVMLPGLLAPVPVGHARFFIIGGFGCRWWSSFS